MFQLMAWASAMAAANGLDMMSNMSVVRSKRRRRRGTRNGRGGDPVSNQFPREMVEHHRKFRAKKDGKIRRR